ncbi:unnamed protein product [Urochloa decumbens]|uniref:Uncharacterized protein n=1 Tax=Urochloa decumbens TaxID=240449 RepID=A0ABC9FM52_9POAL
MLQASSSSAWNRRSAGARVWCSSLAPEAPAAIAPLETTIPPLGDATGLPLIVCPNCGDLRLVAFTCKWTKNCSKTFFKHPRKDDLVANKCGIIMVQSQYEQYLKKNKKIGYLGSTSLVDAVPNLLIEEVEQGKLGLHEMKEELAMVKLGMDEMKNKEHKRNCSRVGCPCIFVVSLVVLFIGWMVLK